MSIKMLANNFIVCGEVLDVLNYREGNVGESNEYFGFTLRIETNKETGQTLDVEYFVSCNSKLFEGMNTIYNEVKTRATNEKGDIVRCVGKIVRNDYVSNGELVEKLVLSGTFCNRQGDSKNKKMDFTPAAIFECTTCITNLSENKVTGIVNEYLTKGGKIKGHFIDFKIGENAKGFNEMVQVDDIVNLQGEIVVEIETRYLPDKDTEELDSSRFFGKAKEKIEKENEMRKKLREEGIQVRKVTLDIVGGSLGLTDEEIEIHKLPFKDEDIDDMINDANERIDRLKSTIEANDADIPF